MEHLQIKPIKAVDFALLRAVINRSFGGEPIVSPTRVFYLDELPALKAVQQSKTIGFIYYYCEDGTCEIVVLVSLARGKGVGNALVTAISAKAKECGCLRLRVFTTNDNVEALKFYEKRGFITTIHRNAMTKVRQYKPQLLTVGANGIPLRDMIELEVAL